MAPRRLAAIDQMRGVAILLVLIYHAGPLAWRLAPLDSDGFLILPRLGWAWLGVPLLHFGFIGVHAFFVVSGFCIHLRAARNPGKLDYKSFFLRRFWRIYPPYWIALALFALALRPSLTELLSHAVMVHSLSPQHVFSINPAFWSLATEEQFYLAYPLILLAIRRFGIARVCFAALLMSLAWRGMALVLLPPTVENFLAWRVLVHALFLPRWFEWLLGCWVAEALVHDRLPRARLLAAGGALLIALGMLTRVNIVVDKLLSDALFAGGFAALTGALLQARSPTVIGLALAAIGRRAYGLYLVHQPILDWRVLGFVRVPLALAAGWIFSRVFERPFERRSQNLRTREPVDV